MSDDQSPEFKINVDIPIVGFGNKAVSGSWRDKSGASGEITIGTKIKGQHTNPLRIAEEFEESMRKIKTSTTGARDHIETLRKNLANIAIDTQVLELFRQNRIAAGRTNHKRELIRERFPRNLDRAVRSIRRSGFRLGWLRGVRWDWPFVKPEGRPYNWEIDGLPSPSGDSWIWMPFIRTDLQPDPDTHIFAKIDDKYFST